MTLLPSVSPFHFFNLFRNPFGEISRTERAELAVVDPWQWHNLLTNSQFVLQFIGPCGHGKTTHLLAIRRAFPEFQYVYLPETGPRPTVPTVRPMMVDEAQRLSYLRLRQLLACGGPLVFATHVDLTRTIERAGLIAVTVEVARETSAVRLAEALNRRIEASRCASGPIPRVSLEMAIRLLSRFGPDLRSIEDYLFEQFQQCVLEQTPWPPVAFPSSWTNPSGLASAVNPSLEPYWSSLKRILTAKR